MGLVAAPGLDFDFTIEAEPFFKQELTEKRAWRVFTPAQRPRLTPDTDGTHVTGASGGACFLTLLTCSVLKLCSLSPAFDPGVLFR